MKYAFSIGIILLCACASNAIAEDKISDCDAALVKSTYNRISEDFVDWRMAENLDESTYNKSKTDAGLSVVIYGVPVGANYNKFQENITKAKKGSTQSYTREQFLNISWTGLDPKAGELYLACLRLVGQALRKPLIILPQGGTASDIRFNVAYNISGKMPNPVNVKWEGSVVEGLKLPTEFYGGETGIVVPRPKDSSTLILNSSDVGNTELIELTPLPDPLPPESKFASDCEIQEIDGLLQQFTLGHSASVACPAMQAGIYLVTVDIRPTSSAMLRVTYALQLVSLVDGKEVVINLPTATKEVDVNAEAGLPHNFVVNSFPTPVPQGPLQLRITLTGAAPHQNFGVQSDAPIQLPPKLTFKLERQGD